LWLHRKAIRAVAALLTAGLLCGCAADPFGAPGLRDYQSPVELTDTPFFPQEDYQCGPAALATVLLHSGVDVDAGELIPKVYIPARHGSLQPEMLAASRAYERIPYVIAPDFAALVAEVAAGRPVLVLQNLGVAAIPVWHYAVVIGYSAEAGEVVLRSGTDRRRVTRAKLFARTWQRSDNWGVIALRPGELPASAEAERYLRAVAAVESIGRFDLAAPAYRAALNRWPDSRLAHLGLGNAAWGMQQPADAERWYRQALDIEPGDSTALNNLATVIAAQGRCDEADALMQRAIDTATGHDALLEILQQSRQEMQNCVPL
jgi:tetratricopeptide (TPR) repeat protein